MRGDWSRSRARDRAHTPQSNFCWSEIQHTADAQSAFVWKSGAPSRRQTGPINNIAFEGRGRRQMRRILIGLSKVLVVLLVVMLLGAAYESVSEAADARAYPPPGQMVDVGGYRLHINCVGTGSPTVVIDAGWGDSSGAWSSWVQPSAASTTRVCTYDRAGLGYSEPGPLPRTAARFARELHTVLRNAEVPGPYVLVGHSAGGLTVRVFADAYPAEVVGVVLIDSMNPNNATPVASAPPPEPA